MPLMMNERWILSRLSGNRFRSLKLEWPVPKSSIASITPSSRMASIPNQPRFCDHVNNRDFTAVFNPDDGIISGGPKDLARGRDFHPSV